MVGEGVGCRGGCAGKVGEEGVGDFISLDTI